MLTLSSIEPVSCAIQKAGEFYEAMGTDAVILVQWAGLNPIGGAHMIPRAQLPHTDIRRTLQSLVEEADLSVVRLSLSMSLKAIAIRTPHRAGLNKRGQCTHVSLARLPTHEHQAHSAKPCGGEQPIRGCGASLAWSLIAWRSFIEHSQSNYLTQHRTLEVASSAAGCRQVRHMSA